MTEAKPDQTAEEGQPEATPATPESTSLEPSALHEVPPAAHDATSEGAAPTPEGADPAAEALVDTNSEETESANGTLALHELETEVDVEAALNSPAEDGAEKPKGFFRRRVQNQEFKKFKAENEKLAAEVDLYRERYLRVAAEMENFRKRTDRDFFSRVQTETARTILAFLPLLDDLERCLTTKAEVRDYDALLLGVRLIQQNFEKILADHGVAPMAATAKEFDPNLHEALTEMASEGKAPGLVLEEHVKGYLLRDKVLRPAKVIVSK